MTSLATAASFTACKINNEPYISWQQVFVLLLFALFLFLSTLSRSAVVMEVGFSNNQTPSCLLSYNVLASSALASCLIVPLSFCCGWLLYQLMCRNMFVLLFVSGPVPVLLLLFMVVCKQFCVHYRIHVNLGMDQKGILLYILLNRLSHSSWFELWNSFWWNNHSIKRSLIT